MAKWLNIAGLILQFVSFWFAAPELVGSDRLRVLETRLRALVGRLPGLVFILAGCSMGAFGAWFGARASHDPEFVGSTPIGITIYLVVVGVVSIAQLLFRHRMTRYLELRVVVPLLRWMIDDEGARARALLLAAVLMTVGFGCQLAAAVLG